LYRYAEAELIGLMEKNGIGTDASIPTHINNIEKRAYVTVQSGRRVVPTDLGVTLVQGGATCLHTLFARVVCVRCLHKLNPVDP
jgi:DNA topoisomerase IA